MIDFVKCFFSDKAKVDKLILNGLNLDCGTYTGISPKGNTTYKVKYKNLFFVSSPCHSYFEGSLHTFFNVINGLKPTNHTHFGINELECVLNYLEDMLDYDFKQTKLTIAEFGFNLEEQVNVSQLIDNHILMYKLKAPCLDPKNRSDMKIKKFEYEDYILKVYNKGLQFRLDKEVLRIELRCNSGELEKLRIRTLNDLRRSNSIEVLYQDFITRFDDLQIVDSFRGNDSMPKKDQQLMIKYTNPNHWLELRSEGKYNLVTHHRKDFEDILVKYNLDSKKKHLLALIINQYNILKVRYSDNILYGITNNLKG